MREFRSIDEFLVFLEGVAAEVVIAQHEGLKKAAEIIEHEAKAEIGEYQAPAGPFDAWPQLSGATLGGFRHANGRWIPGKEELGYAPPDNPLLRDGRLRESIEHTVEGNEAVVGSTDDVAVYQEMGTPGAEYPIPPRSFLGRAAFKKAHTVVEMIGARVVWVLRGLPSRNS